MVAVLVMVASPLASRGVEGSTVVTTVMGGTAVPGGAAGTDGRVHTTVSALAEQAQPTPVAET